VSAVYFPCSRPVKLNDRRTVIRISAGVLSTASYTGYISGT
jgi:hypothetical protein